MSAASMSLEPRLKQAKHELDLRSFLDFFSEGIAERDQKLHKLRLTRQQQCTTS
jgi:hypothetical protein